MQEESRSEHNGMSNAEYATKINEEANSGKEYQEYLGAKESQHAITHLTPEQKANGAGGGGAGWNYAEEDESFSEWKDRRDREKLKQDIDKNILFLILLLVVAVKEIVKKCKQKFIDIKILRKIDVESDFEFIKVILYFSRILISDTK